MQRKRGEREREREIVREREREQLVHVSSLYLASFRDFDFPKESAVDFAMIRGTGMVT